MPVSRNNASRSRKSRIPSKPEATAERLYQLAHRVSANGDVLVSKNWDHELTDIVVGCLADEKDQTLREALGKAASAGDCAAMEELEFNIEHHSTFLVVPETSGKKHIGVQMFAVPILVVAKDGAPLSVLPRIEHYEALVESFTAHGFVPDGCRLVFPNYLYHPEELGSLSWSELRNLPEEFLNFADNAEAGAVPAPVLRQTLSDIPALGAELRFLVGVIASPEDQVPPLIALDNCDPDSPAATKVQDWAGVAVEILSKALDGKIEVGSLSVGHVQRFYEGFRQGFMHYKTLTFMHDLNALITENDIVPKTVRATLAPYLSKDDVVSIKAVFTSLLDGSLHGVCSYLLYTFEKPEDTLEMMESCLRAKGLGNILGVPQLVPEMVCDECSEPAYVCGVENGEALFVHAENHARTIH